MSDHGFAPTATEASLYRPFIDAGLIAIGADGKIATWEAVPWTSGGSIAIVLARPDDAALTSRVRALLDKLVAQPDSVIAGVIDSAGIAKQGGNPQAQFYVDLKSGFLAGGFDGPNVPSTRPAKYKGMHGYFPAAAALRSTFLVAGPGISAGRDFGEIDMRAIVPTLAQILGVRLPDADLEALAVGKR